MLHYSHGGDLLDVEAYLKMWNSLDEEEKDRIRDKARWEHMTRAAVIRIWWPHLWNNTLEETLGGVDGSLLATPTS